MCIVEVHNLDFILGLYTSCSKFPKKLNPISQKVAQKLLFVTKLAQKLLKKKALGCSLPLFALVQKYADCTTKVKISKRCCTIMRPQ